MASRIAYSPTLVLRESYVALYKIYVLKNPFTKEVFYVGQTLQELQTRLTGHVHESGDVNAAKNEYIKELIQKGAKPTIETIETIQATCRIDKALVNEREIYWIKYYKSIGVRLYNIANTHDEAECRDYKNYLRSIKTGEGSYRYYFCGTTFGGHDVYDEKKMRADGFELSPIDPLPRIKIVEKIVEKVIERAIVWIEYVYPSVLKTDHFMPMPAWTSEFERSIPSPDHFMDDMEIDVSDYESIDDFEPDSDSEPSSDFEPDTEENDESDFEVEYDGEDEREAETFDLSTREKQTDYFFKKCRDEEVNNSYLLYFNT